MPKKPKLGIEDQIKNFPEDVQRMFRLLADGNQTPADLQIQVEILRDALFAVCQELETLKAILLAKKDFDAESYKSIRTEVMLSDHSAAGPNPWRGHTYFKYLITEEHFLREILGLNDADIKNYRDRADSLARLT